MKIINEKWIEWRKEAPRCRIIVSYFLLPFVQKWPTLFSRVFTPGSAFPPDQPQLGACPKCGLSGWNPDLQGHDFHVNTSRRVPVPGPLEKQPLSYTGIGSIRLQNCYPRIIFINAQSCCVCVFFLLENLDSRVKCCSSRGGGGGGQSRRWTCWTRAENMTSLSFLDSWAASRMLLYPTAPGVWI